VQQKKDIVYAVPNSAPRGSVEMKPVARTSSVSSTCSTRASEDEPPSKRKSLIVFDWDDTLFPTTFLSRMSLPLPVEVVRALQAHGKLVEQVLRVASSMAQVSIVTLSQRPWVMQSALQFFSGVDFTALFQQLNITVLHAMEHGPAPVLCSQLEYQSLKRNAIACSVATNYNKGSMDPSWINLLSIGDSPVEREATKEFIALRGGSGTGAEATLCKTLKLMEVPTLVNLNAELHQLLPSLSQLVQAQSSFDLVYSF